MIPQTKKILYELSLTPSLLEERDDCIADIIRVSFPNILHQVRHLQHISNVLKKLWYENG